MKKYIVTTDLQVNHPNNLSSVQVTAINEIIDRIYFCGNSEHIFYIYEACSKFETLLLLSSAMYFSIEIDDAREALWKNEIAKIFQEEKRLSKAISEAGDLITRVENQFDYCCKKSNYFKKVKISGEHDLDVLNQIQNYAFDEICEVLKKIYKVKLISP